MRQFGCRAHVVVDGEVVMDERRLTRIDEAAIKAEMIETATAMCAITCR